MMVTEMDQNKIMQRYREYLQKRVENQMLQQQKEEEYKRIVEQRRQEKQIRYSLKAVKTSADRECCICGAHIPKNSRVLHRSGIETNPRTHNPRWVSYYFCSCCRPLNTKEENM